MSFADDIKRHLCEYKRRKFPNFRNGFWMRSNPPKELCYAFVPDDRENNFISHYKALFTQSKFWKVEKDKLKGKDRIKPHVYMHHMNSSQAMCINFFYPLLVENQLDIILTFLKIENEEVDYESACFEKRSQKDSTKKRRPTNFDFYFKTMSGKEFFFEIKYTEYEFAKVKEDEDHREKFDNVYSQLLKPIRKEYQSRSAFLANYQLMRNLIHVDENAYVIFLYPGENRKIRLDAEKAKNEIVEEKYQSHVHPIEWEPLHLFVTNQAANITLLRDQLGEFKLKYFMQ